MKSIFKLCVCLVILGFSATSVFADGMVFEPVEMPAGNVPAQTPVQTTKTSGFGQAKTEPVADMSLKENQSMQSALSDLDSSQIQLRENLQKATAKYTDVDSNYVSYKTQRSALKKEIKKLNKKIKKLEKVKETIRKNML